MRRPALAVTAGTLVLVLTACSDEPDDSTNPSSDGSSEEVTQPALAFDHMDLGAGPTAEFEWVDNTRPVATDDALYLLTVGDQEGTVQIAHLDADRGKVIAQTQPVAASDSARLVAMPAFGEPEALAVATQNGDALDIRTYPLEFDREDPGAHVWAGTEDDDAEWSALGTAIIVTTADEQVAITGHDRSGAVQPNTECQVPEPEGSTFGDSEDAGNSPTVVARVDDQVFTETAAGALCLGNVPIQSEETPESAGPQQTTLIAANHDRALVETNEHAFVADLEDPAAEAEPFTGGSSEAPPLRVESRSQQPARSPDGEWVSMPSVPEGPRGVTVNMLSQAMTDRGATFITETGAFGPNGAFEIDDMQPSPELVNGQGEGKLVAEHPGMLVVTTEPVEQTEVGQESTQTESYPVGVWATN